MLVFHEFLPTLLNYYLSSAELGNIWEQYEKGVQGPRESC